MADELRLSERDRRAQSLNIGSVVSGEWEDSLDGEKKVRGRGSRLFIKRGAGLEGVDDMDYFKECLIPRKRMGGTEFEEAKANWLVEKTLVLSNNLYYHFSEMISGNKAWEEGLREDPDFGFPDNARFLWKRKGKAEVVTSGEYAQEVFKWVDKRIQDQDIFPTQLDVPFPKVYHSALKEIFKYLFRVYAISYSAACLYRTELEMRHSHEFKIFLYFAWCWDLLPARPKIIGREWKPIRKQFLRDKMHYQSTLA